jgi:ATP-dependent Lhr-like helicase
VEGEFLPGGSGTEWCDAEVLRTLRRRSLAALRKEVEPVPVEALTAFLPAWQQVGGRLRGVEGVLRAVEQLQGAQVPASALESLVLPGRVAGYSPAMLDELCAAGEVLWRGHGALPGSDGWVSLHLADAAQLTLPEPDADAVTTPLHAALLDALAGGGAYFFRRLSDTLGRTDDQELVTALWDLVWSGHLTNDTLAPLRTLVGGGRGAHRTRRPTPRGRYARGRPALPSRTGPPTAAGRWSLLPEVDTDPTRRAHTQAEVLLDRHGVVIRAAVLAERAPGGFAAVYRVLAAFEETGRCRRGYFVEGLGAAQFALPGAVDRLRAVAAGLERARDTTARTSDDGPRALVLAATDPANPFGAAVPWPGRGEDARHKPGRKAGALVVLVDGRLVLYVERGGRTLLTWSDDPASLQPAVDALSLAVREGHLGRLTVERADGAGVLDSALGRALEEAGFHATPRGLRLRA